MRQSEFKKKYDPDTGKFSRKHIFGSGNASRTGSGVMDSVKSFFGKKPTKKVSFAVPPPKPTTNNTNKNAGDKIVKLLSGENPSSRKTNKWQVPKMTQQEINNRVLQIMSGGNALRAGGGNALRTGGGNALRTGGKII